MKIKNFTTVEIEGGEGSGKSTLINGLKKVFPDCIFVREPGGVKNSEIIREIVLSNPVNAETEALLFAASRSELVETLVGEPKPIFFDRYVESSIVYQGYVKGVDIEFIKQINAKSLQRINPELVIYLDIKPELGLKRIAENKRGTNRFDTESLAFHESVRNGFLARASVDPRYVTIDASADENTVLQKVIDVLKSKVCEGF